MNLDNRTSLATIKLRPQNHGKECAADKTRQGAVHTKMKLVNKFCSAKERHTQVRKQFGHPKKRERQNLSRMGDQAQNKQKLSRMGDQA